MEYHTRGSKTKGGQSETVKFTRVPSPSSYIQNYNRVCNEEIEQTKACLQIDKKHENLFLWNDGYVSLNRISVPPIAQEFKHRRKFFDSPQPGSEIDEETISQQQQSSQYQGVESYRSQKQQRERQQEKDQVERTHRLEKIIQENNIKQYSIKTMRNHDPNGNIEGLGQKSAAGQVDTNQRKYFSQTKQQMLELKNHLLTSQKISKEIMDRKGLSLRKVLSSIPQDKLMEIIDNKQYHFSKIVNEKILPKKEFRLKSRLSPRFTGEYNYDFHRPSTTRNSQRPFQGASSGYSTARIMTNSNLDHQLKSAHSSKRQSAVLQIDENQTQLPTVNGIQSVALQPEKQSSTQLIPQKTIAMSKQASTDSCGLYYCEEDDEYGQIIKRDHHHRNDKDKKKEMRLKSLQEVQSTIIKLKDIQENPVKYANNNNNIGKDIQNFPADYADQLDSVAFRPKTSLDKMMQKDDEAGRQSLIHSLQMKSKELKPKNFFNYSNYFHDKYSSKNTGLSTKLSNYALQENDKFEFDLLNMIKQIDIKSTQ